MHTLCFYKQLNEINLIADILRFSEIVANFLLLFFDIRRSLKHEGGLTEKFRKDQKIYLF